MLYSRAQHVFNREGVKSSDGTARIRMSITRTNFIHSCHETFYFFAPAWPAVSKAEYRIIIIIRFILTFVSRYATTVCATHL